MLHKKLSFYEAYLRQSSETLGFVFSPPCIKSPPHPTLVLFSLNIIRTSGLSFHYSHQYLPSGKDLRALESWNVRAGKNLRLSCSTPLILQMNKLKTKEANIFALNYLHYCRNALVNHHDHRHFT